MLLKPYRLPAYLIPEVLKKGKKYYFSLFVLSINNQLSTISYPVSRFSIIIPAKLDKRAVKRNKLKRQIRNIIKLNIANLKPGSDVIIMAKKTMMLENFATIKTELEEMLRKARLVKKIDGGEQKTDKEDRRRKTD